ARSACAASAYGRPGPRAADAGVRLCRVAADGGRSARALRERPPSQRLTRSVEPSFSSVHTDLERRTELQLGSTPTFRPQNRASARFHTRPGAKTPAPYPPPAVTDLRHLCLLLGIVAVPPLA